MKNYEEIDQMIRQALSEEEAKFYDELGEQTLPEMVGGLFKGRLKWITIMTMVIMVIFVALAFYCAVQFFVADDLRLTIIWGAGTFSFLLATSMLKLFHWMQMDKNAVIREVKRLELQVGLLNSKIEAKA